ncbi:hypothetical protein LCGC14_0629990 [marine sediment metagenome]|uniref:Uncharacterized protein n=1 Tax=marine sediment metagenome TaxID=412755 RepID=A0A0F9RLT2_9ZZZZ
MQRLTEYYLLCMMYLDEDWVIEPYLNGRERGFAVTHKLCGHLFDPYDYKAAAEYAYEFITTGE